MRISLGYPLASQEIAIIEGQQFRHPIDSLSPVSSPEEIIALQDATRKIHVDNALKKYIVSIVAATRKDPSMYLGASPRGSIALFRTSQARAFLEGRDFVLPDDVKALAESVLAHRLIINPAARTGEVSGKTAVVKVLESIAVPGVKVRE